MKLNTSAITTPVTPPARYMVETYFGAHLVVLKDGAVAAFYFNEADAPGKADALQRAQRDCADRNNAAGGDPRVKVPFAELPIGATYVFDVGTTLWMKVGSCSRYNLEHHIMTQAGTPEQVGLVIPVSSVVTTTLDR
jgi:hypothetical protein